MNVTMEARDDEGACIVVFGIEGKAGGEGVGSMTGSDEFGKVEIKVEEACTIVVI
jgi:hypothetical protein